MKRSPIRRRSKKTAARMSQVKPMYTARFAEHPICEVTGCTDPSSDPHHHTLKRRLGDGLFRFRCVCGYHHNFIHHISPRQAKEQGFLDCLTEDDWCKPNGGR